MRGILVTRFCLVFLVNAAVEVCVRIVHLRTGFVWCWIRKCGSWSGGVCDGALCSADMAMLGGGVFTIIYHLGLYYRGRVEAGCLRRQFPYEVSGLNSAASVFSWYNNPSSRVLY